MHAEVVAGDVDDLMAQFLQREEEQAVDHRPLGDILARAISATTHPALHRVAGHLAGR
ncbi:hypothetical protein [Streptomyces sp. STR69]|uniref:hypothetical protein n=1 Tax=Streptomyces sp. STR69 TaxID=1796942 RepID=UPI0021C92467|nr:hypothetical protein [Streptomyces sp. STR69]